MSRTNCQNRWIVLICQVTMGLSHALIAPGVPDLPLATGAERLVHPGVSILDEVALYWDDVSQEDHTSAQQPLAYAATT